MGQQEHSRVIVVGKSSKNLGSDACFDKSINSEKGDLLFDQQVPKEVQAAAPERKDETMKKQLAI